jgi:hypothetical protein
LSFLLLSNWFLFLSYFIFPLLFRHCFISFSLAHVVSSLVYPNLLGTKRLGCCCWWSPAALHVHGEVLNLQWKSLGIWCASHPLWKEESIDGHHESVMLSINDLLLPMEDLAHVHMGCRGASSTYYGCRWCNDFMCGSSCPSTNTFCIAGFVGVLATPFVCMWIAQGPTSVTTLHYISNRGAGVSTKLGCAPSQGYTRLWGGRKFYDPDHGPAWPGRGSC